MLFIQSPLKPELFLKFVAWVCVTEQQQQTPPFCGERQPRPLLGVEPRTGRTSLGKDAARPSAGKSATH